MENDFYAHVFAVSGFIFFGGPMTAICVLYVLIGVKLKRSRLLQSLPRRAYDANRGLNAQGRVIRMLGRWVALCGRLDWLKTGVLPRLIPAPGRSIKTFSPKVLNWKLLSTYLRWRHQTGDSSSPTQGTPPLNSAEHFHFSLRHVGWMCSRVCFFCGVVNLRKHQCIWRAFKWPSSKCVRGEASWHLDVIKN